MLSIIIPTLNEEDYLPLLLDSIKRQDFGDYELIVADAGSTDMTLQIAREHNCKVVKGGLPAKGRNEGAKAANGELLIFLDSDIILPRDFFVKALQEFKKRSLKVASFTLVPTPFNKFSLLFMEIFYNKPIALLENILPHAAIGILIEKTVFEKINGFDEDIKLAEDHYLARQAHKLLKAKCGIIQSTKIFVSDRRFRKDGWVTIGLKYLLCELHLIFIGPVKSNIFNYRFNHYKDEFKNQKSKFKI